MQEWGSAYTWGGLYASIYGIIKQYINPSVYFHYFTLLCHLAVGGVAVQVVQHDNRPTRVIVDHRPEVNDGVSQGHLRHYERITLLVSLSHCSQLLIAC